MSSRQAHEQGYEVAAIPRTEALCHTCLKGATQHCLACQCKAGKCLGPCCVCRLLTSAVYNPRNVLVFSAMGDGCELAVQPAAAFAHAGEALAYWQLQVA